MVASIKNVLNCGKEIREMVSIDEFCIVNYCHPNCIPLKNIIRLPKEEAFFSKRNGREKS
jgi:hypothetical protein